MQVLSNSQLKAVDTTKTSHSVKRPIFKRVKSHDYNSMKMANFFPHRDDKNAVK